MLLNYLFLSGTLVDLSDLCEINKDKGYVIARILQEDQEHDYQVEFNVKFWNQNALRLIDEAKENANIILRGYLTTYKVEKDGRTYLNAELTASDFILG